LTATTLVRAETRTTWLHDSSPARLAGTCSRRAPGSRLQHSVGGKHASRRVLTLNLLPSRGVPDWNRQGSVVKVQAVDPYRVRVPFGGNEVPAYLMPIIARKERHGEVLSRYRGPRRLAGSELPAALHGVMNLNNLTGR